MKKNSMIRQAILIITIIGLLMLVSCSFKGCDLQDKDTTTTTIKKATTTTINTTSITTYTNQNGTDDPSKDELKESEGLEFAINEDGNSYSVISVGSCNDSVIVIPDTYEGLPVTVIGYGAFANCYWIKSVVLGNNVTAIESLAFCLCKGLGEIVFSDSLARVDQNAFMGCYNLDYNTFDNAKYLGYLDNPYYLLFDLESTGFSEITIHKDTKLIVGNTFYYSKTLSAINVEDESQHFKSIDGNLYSKDGTVLVQYIRSKADETFRVPDGVVTIGAWAFFESEYLVNVVLPQSVTKIEQEAFWGCRSLANINLPASLTYIGENAFYFCVSITNLNLSSSVSRIDTRAFGGCHSLETIDVDNNNQYYRSIDGNLYTKDGKTIVQYAIGKKDTMFTIPDTVTTVNDWAFGWNKFLEHIILPDSVTYIGEGAFFYAPNLKSIDFSDSLIYIGAEAFHNCNSLVSLSIPASVEKIGDGAFNACYSLTGITVNENNQYFKSIDDNLYTKDGQVLIQYAAGKSERLFEIPDSVVGILGGAFWGADDLIKIIIPNTVKVIDHRAFINCSSLTTIVIPISVELIGTEVFWGCSQLEDVIFEGSMQEWNDIPKYDGWDLDFYAGIICSDGVVVVQ